MFCVLLISWFQHVFNVTSQEQVDFKTEEKENSDIESYGVETFDSDSGSFDSENQKSFRMANINCLKRTLICMNFVGICFGSVAMHVRNVFLCIVNSICALGWLHYCY